MNIPAERMAAGSALHNLFIAVIFIGLGGLVIVVVFFRPQLKKGTKPKPSTQKSFAGEMYYPVYEYASRSGDTIRAESGSGANWMGRNVPGRNIILYVDKDDPATVSPAGFLSLIVGSLFIAPALLLIYVGITHMEFNATTGVIGAIVAVLLALKIKKFIRPRSEWKTKESFREQKTQKRLLKRAEGRLLSAQEIRERLRVQDRQASYSSAFVALVAVALIVGGVHANRRMEGFLSGALQAEGEVVRIESRHGGSSDGAGYTYYPVVSFKTAQGEQREFTDSFGSNPAFYQIGDRISVLYDPVRANKAIIDRGLMNWSTSVGFFGFGGLLLLWVIRVVATVGARQGRI